MAVKIGESNAFGMRVTALNGGMLDLECEVCGSHGMVAAKEFQSTRCGSPRCASSQGRVE